MIASIKRMDVVDCFADALIYSTNVFLNCSGGVGSTLMSRYGEHFQEDLHNLLKDSDVKYAAQGSVYEMVSSGMPYKAIFHTVPCDGFYDTSTEIVTDVLKQSLDACVRRVDISSVAISLLASGYGKMEPDEFLRIASDVLSSDEYSSIDRATICIYDEGLFQQASKQVTEENLRLEDDTSI